MAIGIRVTLDGATAEMFDQVNALIDPDSNPPEGLLFHASRATDTGLEAIDFWRSRADYDRFGQERIAPRWHHWE
jgi:hypothetical protein